ncbi:MAG: Flp pilus assembly protein CpaB [Pseudomonadales bacterium]
MSLVEGFKKQSTLSMLVVSVFLGLIAAGLAVLYLKNREAALAKQYQKPPEVEVAVVVPVRDLMPGEIIALDTVAARKIPEKYVGPDVITAQYYKKVEGRRLQYPAARGKPIPLNSLSGINMGDFSDSIAAGRRAITIKVDRINSMDGMLRPGNHIDILVGMPAGQAGAEPTPGLENAGAEEVVFPVLENVVVIATGSQDSKSMQSQRSGAVMTDKDYSSVTVDLFPEQVAMLKVAEEAGRIIAALRNRNDGGSSGFDAVRPSQLMSLMRKARNAELARASTEVVRDVNGNAIGKVVGGVVYDAQGNVIGKVNADGKVVDAKGKVIGEKVKAQIALGSDGRPVGQVVGDKVYDANGNQIGRVVDGKVVSNDGRMLGHVSESVAVDAKGNVIGNVVNGVVYDKDGNVIGKVNDKGQVVDDKGNVIGAPVGKVAVDAKGKPIGKVVGDKVYDADGKLIARVDANGNVVDLNGKIVGKVSDGVQQSKVAIGKDGKTLGRIVDGKVIDAMGNVVGTVNADGTVTDVNGNVIGQSVGDALVDAKGNIVANEVVGSDGKVIGKVIGDKVYDDKGNVVATVSADGSVKANDGRVLDVSVRAGTPDAAPLLAVDSNIPNIDSADSEGGISGRSYESMSGGNKENGVLKLDKTSISSASKDAQALPQGK